jgi:hypothetical protein
MISEGRRSSLCRRRRILQGSRPADYCRQLRAAVSAHEHAKAEPKPRPNGAPEASRGARNRPNEHKRRDPGDFADTCVPVRLAGDSTGQEKRPLQRQANTADFVRERAFQSIDRETDR